MPSDGAAPAGRGLRVRQTRGPSGPTATVNSSQETVSRAKHTVTRFNSRNMTGFIWNRDRLYEIMDFGTYMYVLVCTEYIPVRNAENGTYLYVMVCTEFVQVL